MRRWLLNWLLDTATVEVSTPFKKYAVIIASSIIGGMVYGRTGSWLEAIRWDLTSMFVIWIATLVAEMLGKYIVRFLLFVLGGEPI